MVGSNFNLNAFIQDSCCYQEAEDFERDYANEAEKRIDRVIGHMYNQYKEHEEAAVNTKKVFNNLLDNIEHVVK